MSQFGLDYKREVNDVNEGRAIPKESTRGLTTSQSSTGAQIDRLETRPKTSGIRNLVNFAAETATGINKKQQRERFQAAYANSVTDAQQKLDTANKEESGIFSLIFGKSPEHKGFHKRVLENETSAFHLQQLQKLPSDVRAHATTDKYYSEVIAPALQTALSKQNDSEMRANIIENFSKVAQNLGAQYVPRRATYEQAMRRKAAQEGLLGHLNLLRKVQETGEGNTEAFEKSVIDELTNKKHGVDPQAHQDILMNVISGDLAQGNPEGAQLLDQLIDKGTIKLDSKNQQTYSHAKETYLRTHSFNYIQKTFALQQAALEDAPDFEQQVLSGSAQYGSANVNPNAWREIKHEIDIDKQQQAIQLNTNIDLFLNNGHLSKPDTQEAAIAIEQRTATQLVQNKRKEQLIRQQQSGVPPEEWIDLHEKITREQMESALLDHPEALLETAATTGKLFPIMKSAFRRQSTLLNKDKHTEEDLKELTKLTNFTDRLRKRDYVQYTKSASSDSELARVEQLNYLRGSGMRPHEALQTIRENEGRTPYDYGDDYDTYTSDVEQVFDEAGDEIGFTAQWGIADHDPDNREEMMFHARLEYDKALKITKNPETAKPIARAFLVAHAARLGNDFVWGGAKFDNGAIEPMSKHVPNSQEDPRTRIKLHNARFEDGVDLQDPKWKKYITPDGNILTISGKNTNGDYVFTTFHKPTRQADIYQPPKSAPPVGIRNIGDFQTTPLPE